MADNAPAVEESQPASDASSIVRKHVAAHMEAPEPVETPQTPEAAGEAPVETFDPATITIPDRQFVTNVPKALDKVRGKNLIEVGRLIEETDRWGHSKAEEAAQAKRENEDLRTRLAAAEQYARMTQQPAQPEQDAYQRAGIDLEGLDPITRSREVMQTTLSEADRIAQARADAAARKEGDAIRAEFRQKAEEAQLITAFELARAEVGKLKGQDVTIEEWQNDLQDIARIVHSREPNRKFDHKAYVETYVRLRGVPKVSVPTEGNPPLASRPANVKPEKSVPTLSREEQQLNKQIRKSLGLES